MKIRVQRELLLKPLQLISGVVERKQTLPVLANVLLNANDQELNITATDLEVELKAQIKAEGGILVGGTVTVPGRKLADICKVLPDEAVMELQVEGERVIVRSGQSRYTLTTLPADEFPQSEEKSSQLEFFINQQDLRFLLQRTYFAMAQQDVRYYLNGILFELSEGAVRTVATDGHRLAMSAVNTQTITSQAMRVIIPRKGVIELMKLLDDTDANLTITMGTNHLRVTGPQFTFTTKLLEGRYPEYDRILPKGGDKTMLVDRDALKQALQRAAILCSDKMRALGFQLRSGLLRIHAHNPEHEEAEEVITLDSYQGADLDLGFNVAYLFDILNTVNAGDVRFTFSDNNSGVLVEEANGSGDSLFVIMPMKL